MEFPLNWSCESGRGDRTGLSSAITFSLPGGQRAVLAELKFIADADRSTCNAVTRAIASMPELLQATQFAMSALGDLMLRASTAEEHAELCRRRAIVQDTYARATGSGALRLPSVWTAEDDARARFEGWMLCQHSDSHREKWDVRRVRPNEGSAVLASDDDAIQLVMQGTKPHHQAARLAIARGDPMAWAEMCERHLESRRVVLAASLGKRSSQALTGRGDVIPLKPIQ